MLGSTGHAFVQGFESAKSLNVFINMIVRAGVLVCLCVVWVQASMAQTDTTYLREVQVYGLPVTSHAVGAKVDQLEAGGVGTLSDKLRSDIPLYLKSYGNNQLSTISIRGTTASQTAVLWNGININSPTLGQSDLALLPLYLFDELSVRYGGASALYGSDAIGGSILLGQQQPSFIKRTTFTFDQQIASFGRFDTGMKAAWGGSRWQFSTKAIHTYLGNDFPYHSPAVGYEKKQNNASVRNYGVDQQVQYKINDRQYVGVEAMYTDNHRHVQPPVTNNDSHEVLNDRNTRVSANYHNQMSAGILTATAAYVFNDEDYVNGTTSTNRSDQLVLQAGFNQDYGSRLNVRYGLSYARYSATSANFDDNLAEYRFDGYVSSRYMVSRNWLMNLDLRQALYDGKYAPFTPSFGMEYYLLNQETQKLSLRGQTSRAYRVPTLNDRYWIPGGNPTLKPEDAWQAEVGVNWKRTMDSFGFESSLTAYRGWVNEMIVWRPAGSFWSPQNLQNVDLSGIEAGVSGKWKTDDRSLKTSLQYAFTRSINRDALSASDQSTVGNQLPYVPNHSLRINVSAGYKSWAMFVGGDYTSCRYTTIDNVSSYSLDPFFLLDAGVSRRVQWTKLTAEFTANVRNIFNVYYETLENHAMPGTNVGVSVKVRWDRIKN
ncbi:TonB-dependent receptor [Chryseolinea sp. T2]|uniref:TonB-dependent receptor plug domain-containing protein n=1 Tax=Chryseolinea sp. T2 TaxID=3129255 RepID=UPI003078510F